MMRLSLHAVGRLTAELIRNKYEDEAVRPEVHSPDQGDGDIADVPSLPQSLPRTEGEVANVPLSPIRQQFANAHPRQVTEMTEHRLNLLKDLSAEDMIGLNKISSPETIKR